jgi:hypothetical protein
LDFDFLSRSSSLPFFGPDVARLVFARAGKYPLRFFGGTRTAFRRRAVAGAPTRNLDDSFALALVAFDRFFSGPVTFERARAWACLFAVDFARFGADAFLTAAFGLPVLWPVGFAYFRLAPARGLSLRIGFGDLADFVTGLAAFLGSFPFDTTVFRLAIVLGDRGKCRPDGFLILLFLADFFVKADIRNVRVR